MRTIIFCHKGIVGIQSSPKAEGLLNKPLDKGQLGFVVDASYVDVQPEALELLKKVPGSGDDLGEVDVFKSSDGVTALSWLGGPLKAFKPDEITSSNDYQVNLLTPCENVETPQSFIDFVEKENGTEKTKP